MNAKQLGLLVVVAAVLGAAVWLGHRQDSAAWSGAGRQPGAELLGQFQVNDVATVSISRGADHVTLAKNGDRWQVTERAGFPAAFSDLKALLLKLQGLKVVQSDDLSAAQRPRLQLAGPDAGTNAATVLELRDASGKVLRSLSLGKKHQHNSTDGSEGWPDGRYVLADTNADQVQVVADALTEVEPAPANWLDKDFVKLEHVTAFSASYPAVTNSWSLTRTNESADWQLVSPAAGEKLDSTKLTDLSSPLSGWSLADVQTAPVTPGSNVQLEARTADGFDYVFQVGTKTGDNYPVSLAVSAALSTNQLVAGETLEVAQQKLAHDSALTNWTYLVPSWNLDSVLKHRADWLVVSTNTVTK
jgi:hypothetical protein